MELRSEKLIDNPEDGKGSNNVSVKDSKSGDIVFLLVFVANDDSGIKDHNSLQNFGKLSWKIHRLLWIAYSKNMNTNITKNKKKCFLSTLPKDVIKFIITFFLIDNKSNMHIKHYNKHNTTFKDIHDRYLLELPNYVLNYKNKSAANFENCPLIRVWCKLGCIKNFYLIEKNKMTVTINDLNDILTSEEDLNRWVELPDGWLGIGLNDKKLNIVKYNQICIEYPFLDVLDKKNINSKHSKQIYHIYNSNLYWPLSKYNNDNNIIFENERKWIDIRIGDVIDVLVKYCMYM